jgi:hypothetical protein
MMDGCYGLSIMEFLVCVFFILNNVDCLDVCVENKLGF